VGVTESNFTAIWNIGSTIPNRLITASAVKR
jgi:hypothetical protein